MTKKHLEIPRERLEAFCRSNGIQRLSFFGSVLSDHFGPDSDLDVLVEFKAGTRIGLIRLTRLQYELSDLFGRSVDLNTPRFLSRYFRDAVMAESEVQYAES